MINVSEEMNHLHKLAQSHPDKRFTHLWERLVAPEWLMQAWEQIRNNHGSQTPGVDQMTVLEVDVGLIGTLAHELKTHTFRPLPVRRVRIPKANGKTRPLGIATLKDRIVQQGLKMLLEPIFEADFLTCSHGFRPGRSPHTALRDVACQYQATGWTVEGDLQNCFDAIPVGKLMQQIARRIADEKILHLIKCFLNAGYMENWKFHQTYSGTPQGSIFSPLAANLYLHQLDVFMVNELEANRSQSVKESRARVNPDHRKLTYKIDWLRSRLKRVETPTEGRALIKDLIRLEKQRKHLPYFARDKRHPCKIKYVRFADDWVVLVAGSRQEAETVKAKIRTKLAEMGLTLNEEKTKITHWSQSIRFLGFDIRGKLRRKGVGIRAVLCIPREKVRQVEAAIAKIGSYHHIPEVDAMIFMSAVYRGWCGYYRYATSPQPTFNRLAKTMWWMYAHYLARRQRSSIAAMIRREIKAGKLGAIQKGDRKRNTFQTQIGKRTVWLDIFPPKSGTVHAIGTNQDWKVDLKPVTPLNWQSGRSLATGLKALERAGGVCERCRQNPVAHVHHTMRLRGKTFLARIAADQSPKYSATALCQACHLESHGGSFKPKMQPSGRNAGYAQRCLSGVGRAAEKPISER